MDALHGPNLVREDSTAPVASAGWRRARRQQLHAAAEPARTGLFRGKVFCVRGRPPRGMSMSAFHALISMHGGVVDPFFSVRGVHVYIDSEPLALGKADRMMRRGTRMTHPDWIVACVRAGRLLSMPPLTPDTTVRPLGFSAE